jgi:hypothetical protein
LKKKRRKRENKVKVCQDIFLRRFGEEIRTEIRGVALRPAPITNQAAVLAMRLTSNQHLRFGYHGTSSQYYPSIFKDGLLVPGEKEHITVRNGSAYGIGIYSANPGNHSLSLSYSNTTELLVCAICTNNPHVAEHQNRFRVITKSAMITPMLIAKCPLQTACYSSTPTASATSAVVTRPAPLQQLNNRSSTQYCTGKSREYFEFLDELVWIPPQSDATQHEIKTKRRLNKTRQTLAKKHQREAKFSQLYSS